ncbi:peptidoglycan editing factor PgeF [Parasphingorhabdus sp. SCSIO 66989]|uniref:Purine nucleoside phosphorylase n=2 Tax=Alterisphingorhabdus coralli TaxID=3071408 RepID=A0AA97FA32_9SPHN|nr:peptidoglycan editing factor PgeF [Parasphingorhabdus sp. SCSIO 66989]WOE75280.1 peptidoglycan editing factor PgeF [Parasphingorhabdus sp. SCSIO 66989]
MAKLLSCSAFDDMDRIAHGFTTRAEDLADLGNTGLAGGGDLATAQTNRRLWAGAVLADAPLVGVYQIHSAEVVTVSAPWDDANRPKADAMVTDQPNILLGVLGADCAPVLLADDAAGVVGAAHAGWQGALAGVTDATVDAMEKLGATRENIIAAIGPCIAQKSYEVDSGFYRKFCEANAENDRFFGAGKDSEHHQFDLEGYIAARLSGCGVHTVACMGEDTYTQPDRFFSHRRATHEARDNEGRQLGMIGLRA